MFKNIDIKTKIRSKQIHNVYSKCGTHYRKISDNSYGIAWNEHDPSQFLYIKLYVNNNQQLTQYPDYNLS